MNNEIKEILEALRDSIDDTGTNKVNFINWVDKIEDYITNLQKERNSMACLVNDIQEDLDNLQQIEKDHQKLNGELREENERLNNITKELEQWLNFEIKRLISIEHDDYTCYQYVLDKLNELKENK